MFYEKSLAYCFICYRHSYLYRQCVCLECAYAPNHAADGMVVEGNDLDIFPCNPVPRVVGRFSGKFRRKAWPEEKRPYFDVLLWHRHVRYGLCAFGAESHAALCVLWGHRRHWSWCWLYHTGVHACQVFPEQSRLCYGPCHHGLRLCKPHRRPFDAASYGGLWAGGQFPHSGCCLYGHHVLFSTLSQAANGTGREQKQDYASGTWLYGE